MVDTVMDKTAEMEEMNLRYKKFMTKVDPYATADVSLANQLLDSGTMSEEDKKVCLLKCYANTSMLDRELAKYEFLCAKPTRKQMTFEQFRDRVVQLVSRYHYKVGGHTIDDPEWTLHECMSEKYDLDTTEFILDNTINSADIEDRATVAYLVRLAEILNNISVDYRCKIKFIRLKRDNIFLLMLRCYEDGEDEEPIVDVELD